jgi:hypothetical protein
MQLQHTTTTPTYMDVYFDKFNISKEEPFYKAMCECTCGFDFNKFITDYNTMQQTEQWYPLFVNFVNWITCLNDTVRRNTVRKPCSRHLEIIMLSVYILVDSYESRIVRRIYRRFDDVSIDRFKEVLKCDGLFESMVHLIPFTIVNGYDYDFLVLCWDKVREGDGVFSEFDEYVVDSSNMMSEVLRFL